MVVAAVVVVQEEEEEEQLRLASVEAAEVDAARSVVHHRHSMTLPIWA